MAIAMSLKGGCKRDLMKKNIPRIWVEVYCHYHKRKSPCPFSEVSELSENTETSQIASPNASQAIKKGYR